MYKILWIAIIGITINSWKLGYKLLFAFNNLDQRSLATVIMSVDQSILSSICGNGTAQDNSINFIINEDRQVVSYPDEEFTGNPVNSGYI